MTIKELIKSKLTPIGDSIRAKKGVGGLIPIDDMPMEIDKIITSEEANNIIKVLVSEGIIENLAIPEGVSYLRESALSGYILPKNLYLPEGLTRIDKYCIRPSTKVGLNVDEMNIYIPSTLSNIGNSAFSPGELYTNIYFNMSFENYLKNVTSIEGYDFYERSIGKYHLWFKNAIGEYKQLDFKNITIPENVTELKTYACSFGGVVVGVKLHPNITKLNESFMYSKSSDRDLSLRISDVYVYENTEVIPKAFNGCILNKVTFQKEYSEIPNNFCRQANGSYNYGMNEIIFEKPDKITKIGDYVFKDCQLIKFEIPKNVTSIGAGAFSNHRFKTITIPEKVTYLGFDCFYVNNYQPSKCTYIFKSNTPPTAGGTLFSKSYISKIYVPKQSANAYKSATNWSTYADYIFESNTVTVSIPDTLINNENYTYAIDGGDFQQFTIGSLTLETIGTFQIKNSGGVTINVGTTNGGTEIGSVGTGAELLYATESDTTIYLTVA